MNICSTLELLSSLFTKSLSKNCGPKFPSISGSKLSRSVRITHAGSLGVGLGLGGWGFEGGKGVHIT